MYEFLNEYSGTIIAIVFTIGICIGVLLGIAYKNVKDIFQTVWLPSQYELKHFTKEEYQKDKKKAVFNYITHFLLPLMKPKTFMMVVTGEFLQIAKRIETPEFKQKFEDNLYRIQVLERTVLARNVDQFKMQTGLSYIETRLVLLSVLSKYSFQPKETVNEINRLINKAKLDVTSKPNPSTVINLILSESSDQDFKDQAIVLSMLTRILLNDETFRSMIGPVFAYKLYD